MSTSVALDWEPASRSTSLPSLKKSIVGIDMMRNCWERSDSSSTLYFPMLALSPNSAATSSMMGDMRTHGPHHVAQQSISVGRDEAM